MRVDEERREDKRYGWKTVSLGCSIKMQGSSAWNEIRIKIRIRVKEEKLGAKALGMAGSSWRKGQQDTCPYGHE